MISTTQATLNAGLGGVQCLETVRANPQHQLLVQHFDDLSLPPVLRSSAGADSLVVYQNIVDAR